MSELSEEDYIDTYDGDNGSEMYYESGKERNGNERDVCMVVCIGYVVSHLE